MNKVILMMISLLAVMNTYAEEVDWLEEPLTIYINNEPAHFENDNIYEWLEYKLEQNETSKDCIFSRLNGLADFNDLDEYLALRAKVLEINPETAKIKQDLFIRS